MWISNHFVCPLICARRANDDRRDLPVVSQSEQTIGEVHVDQKEIELGFFRANNGLHFRVAERKVNQSRRSVDQVYDLIDYRLIAAHRLGLLLETLLDEVLRDARQTNLGYIGMLVGWGKCELTEDCEL